MVKSCPYCDFNNPLDVNQCLSCKKKLPSTFKDLKEGVNALKEAAHGDWSGAARKTYDETVGRQVSAFKYRFSPKWVVKVKIHKIKRGLKSLLWVLAIVAGLAIFGLILNALDKIF